MRRRRRSYLGQEDEADDEARHDDHDERQGDVRVEILYGDHDDDGEQTGENHRVDAPDDEFRIVEGGYVNVPCFRGQISADDQKQGFVEVDEGKNLLAVARIAVEDFVGHDRIHVEAFDLEN